MKDETKSWLEYSFENMKSEKVLIENHLYNPCLQNVQQCVEKTPFSQIKTMLTFCVRGERFCDEHWSVIL